MNTVMWTTLTMLAPILWGTTYIVTSELLPEGMPYTSAVIRCLPAGIGLLLLSRYKPRFSEWKPLAILSFLNITCFQGLLFVAAYRLPGGLAAVLGAIQPLIILFLGWALLSQRPNVLSFLSCVTAVIGMACLILQPIWEGQSTWDVIGLAAALGGAMSMALGTFLTKHWQLNHTLNIPIASLTGWQLTLGGILLLPFSLTVDPVFQEVTTHHILSFSYLIIFGTLLSYLAWFKGIQKLSPVAVSALGLLSPVSATVLGWYFLNQTLEGWALIGLPLVIGSVLMVQLSQLKNFKQQKLSTFKPQEKMV